MQGILIGLIPALMWGIQPLIMDKIGGKSTNQQMGMGMGALIFAIIVYFFRKPTNWDTNILIYAFLSGIVWAFAEINLIKALHMVGVATTSPICTGIQLVGTALVGAFYFKEWVVLRQYIFGISALIFIVAGILFTTFRENKHEAKEKNVKKGFICIILAGISFVLYAVIPRLANIDSWDALLPQAVGIFVGSLIFCSFESNPMIFSKKSFQNIFLGLVFATGNIVMMISNEINGVAVGFTLSQMNVAVSVLIAFVILREHKTVKEMKFILLGVGFILIGGVLIGLTKM